MRRRGLKARVHRIVAAPRRALTPTAPLPDMAIPFVDRVALKTQPPAADRKIELRRKP
jgi:hypothetical protein